MTGSGGFNISNLMQVSAQDVQGSLSPLAPLLLSAASYSFPALSPMLSFMPCPPRFPFPIPIHSLAHSPLPSPSSSFTPCLPLRICASVVSPSCQPSARASSILTDTRGVQIKTQCKSLMLRVGEVEQFQKQRARLEKANEKLLKELEETTKKENDWDEQIQMLVLPPSFPAALLALRSHFLLTIVIPTYSLFPISLLAG